MGAQDRRWTLAVGLAAGLPVLVSAVRAMWVGWIGLGDDAVIVARSYDVLSTHPPLLGQFSASSGVLAQDVHSLGPLSYWVLAIPAHLGPGWVPALVTGLINLLCVMGCVELARRRGGRPLALAFGVVLAAACGSMTAETWHTVWNPSVALLPFMLLVMVAWDMACGAPRRLPLAVFLASFVAQCHLTYVLPALGVLAVAAVGLVRARPASWRAPLLAAVAVGAVCWSAPLLEEIVHRPGNVVLAIRTAREPGPRLGAATGARTVVQAIGVTPWWLRGPREGITRLGDVSHVSALAAGSALLLFGGLMAAVVLGLRARRTDVVAGAALALVLCLAMASVSGGTPASGILFISVSYTLRWASLAGAFCWVVVGWSAATLVVAPARARRRSATGVASTGRGRRAGRALPVWGAVAAVASVGAWVAIRRNVPDRFEELYGPVHQAAERIDAAVPTELPRIRVQSPSTFNAMGFDVPAGIVTELRRDGRHPQTDQYAQQFGKRYQRSRPQVLVTVGPSLPGPGVRRVLGFTPPGGPPGVVGLGRP